MNYYSKKYIQIILFSLCSLLSNQASALLEECPNRVNISPKKIVIFTDGTANTKGDQTNVRQLYERIVNQGRNDIIAYYDRGVGNLGTKVIGGAVGLGFSRNVRQAYRCLADHYRPGDQIYLFGFSRGAYTARVLGGLIHLMGIISFPDGMGKSDQKNLVKKMYAIYKKNETADFDLQREHFQSSHTTNTVSIDVMGVWDTVAALGLAATEDKLHERCLDSGIFSWFGQLFGKDEDSCLLERAGRKLYQDYHKVDPKGIQKILHAVSIDERRNAFKIELYDKANLIPDQILKQVWFAGVHSDVGGGYDDSKALSTLSLNWMIQNLRDDNLLPIGTVVTGGSYNGLMHTSYKNFYKKADPRIREMKPGSVIHESVVKRMINTLAQANIEREPDGKYRPVQFEQCLQGQKPTLEKIKEKCLFVVDDQDN